MTNRERLNRMSTDEYARETAAFAACPVRQFVDYEGWLESSEPEYPIIGKPGIYDTGKREESCYIVGEFDRSGRAMMRIVIPRKRLHDFELLTVQADKVNTGQITIPTSVTEVDPKAFEIKSGQEG